MGPMSNIKPRDVTGLLEKLSRAGYEIRRHCCDHYIGDGERLICAFAIYPRWGEIRIYDLTEGNLPKKVTEIFGEFADSHSLKLIIKNVRRSFGILRC